jgi:hypothetical protein
MGGSRTRRKSPIADARVLLKVDIFVIDISIDDFERNRKNRMQIV